MIGVGPWAILPYSFDRDYGGLKIFTPTSGAIVVGFGFTELLFSGSLPRVLASFGCLVGFRVDY